MKKSKLVRLIALCLVALMVVSACATTPDDTPNTPQPPPTETGPGPVVPPPPPPGATEWAAKETLDITMGLMGVPAFGEYGFLDDPLTQHLNEMFNIRINTIDARDESDFSTLLAGMIATGDIPDIFPAVDETLRQLVEANALLDINQYINPELTPTFASDNQFKAAAMVRSAENGWGNSLFCVPLVKGTHDAGGPLVGDWIRWDLYKELGYPTMRTPDDLLNVLKDMQDRWPENHEGQKAYAVSGWWGDGMGWGDWTIQYYRFFNSEISPFFPYPFITAMNKETLELYPNNQLLDDNGYFWRTVSFFNKAHQMGILDPESFIQDWGAWVNKLENGQIYHLLPGWMPFEAQRAYDELGFPEMGFGHVPGIGSDVQSLVTVMLAGERIVSISNKTKDPERMVALLDYMSTYEFSGYAWNGLEGPYWETVDGIPTPKPDYNNPDLTSDERKTNSGAEIYNLMCGYAGATINPSSGMPIFLRHHPISVEATLSIVQRDILNHFGAETLIEAYSKNLKVYQPLNTYAPPPYPDDLNFDHANLYDYVFKNIYTVIRTNTEDEYQAAKEHFKSELMQFRIDEMFNFQYNALREQEEFAKQVLEIFNQG